MLSTVHEPAPVSPGEPLRVFWAPGCSSCVKVKEHLQRLGVDFVGVNVAADPGARDELQRMGIRSVPVVVRGGRYVFAQSLEDVSAFVGKVYVRPPRQAVSFLFERWLFILALGQQYLDATPATVLTTDVIPERRRSIGELGYHVFQVAAAFVHCMRTGETEWFKRASGPADTAVYMDDQRLRSYARATLDDLRAYYQQQPAAFRDVPMAFEGGLKSTYEFLDRSAWHSAQHVRQLAEVLVREGVTLPRAWSETFVDGLGVPEKLWT